MYFWVAAFFLRYKISPWFKAIRKKIFNEIVVIQIRAKLLGPIVEAWEGSQSLLYGIKLCIAGMSIGFWIIIIHIFFIFRLGTNTKLWNKCDKRSFHGRRLCCSCQQWAFEVIQLSQKEKVQGHLLEVGAIEFRLAVTCE